MNADMIAAWAVENGFHAIDSGNYRRHDNAGVITIEIKRMSFLLIDERQGFAIVQRHIPHKRERPPAGSSS